MARAKKNPRILIVTPEITYLPEGMGNLAGKMSAKAGGMADDGATVKSGQIVCVVEAMKLFNPIKASAAGKITFLVEHGKAVTKGQVIAAIA